MVTKDGPIYIDPRGYFGNSKKGPIEYDISKYLYSIYGYYDFNYDVDYIGNYRDYELDVDMSLINEAWVSKCPCGSVGSFPAPSFVGSDYYCEAGYQGSGLATPGEFYSSDRLWDGKDCGSSETACCQRTLILGL